MKYLILFLALCASARAANFFYPVTAPIKQWYDTKGQPLVNGYIYFGVANQNPQTVPITMYWDAAGLIPASQPFRTSGGYIYRQGSPANVYAAGDFSVSVFTNSGILVFTQPTSVDLQLALSIAGSSSAAAIPVADSGNYYTHPATVETALDQVGPLITQMVTALAGTTPTGARIGFVGTVAPTGWVLGSGRTIGDASSGALERANADTANLYTLMWNSYTNTALVIQDSAGTPTTRGASASNDFAAHKRLPLPDYRGRVPGGKDDMGGSTAGRLTAAGMGSGQVGTAMGAASTGATGFTETHAMTSGELASHTHTFTGTAHNHTATDSGHTHTLGGNFTNINAGTSGLVALFAQGSSTATSSGSAVITVANTTAGGTNSSTGSNTAFSVVQPTIIETVIIKL